MPVLLDQRFARYIFENSKVKNGRVKDGAFKPKKGEDLSVYDIDGLNHDETCEHGHQHADNNTLDRVHIGYAGFDYQTVKRIELHAIYDDPQTRHVSISFSGDPESNREKSKALARNSVFYPC